METTKILIEKLLNFGLHHKMMAALDVPQVRNQLLTLLQLHEPYDGIVQEKVEAMPTQLLNALLDDAVARNVIEDSMTSREIMDAKIMAQLMPRQSELNHIFNKIKAEEGVEAATDYYYHLSQVSNYIRTDRIALNNYWLTDTRYGDLEITINLSKPEKDPKDIEKAKLLPQSNYPKCFLCLENVGYEGNLNHPARSNHRVIPLTLNGESWFLQYSPYVYYNEHAIIFKAAHEPMKITIESFKRLVDFVEAIPHYFIGSNADLPIVGGSILSHDHFQGGHHRFPMVDAKVLKSYTSDKNADISIQMIEWPLSVIRIASSDKNALVNYAYEIFQTWRDYSDESVGIYSYSMVEGDKIPHNTITPITRMNDEGLFEIDLALRNNRRSAEHPDGIFHPHAHLHHIKKENIGLIEVMGLAVLPARLDADLVELSQVLQGLQVFELVATKYPHHLEWFKEIGEQVGYHCSEAVATKALHDGVGKRFAQVLDCAGVYKQDVEGLAAFDRFIRGLGVNQG